MGDILGLLRATAIPAIPSLLAPSTCRIVARAEGMAVALPAKARRGVRVQARGHKSSDNNVLTEGLGRQQQGRWASQHLGSDTLGNFRQCGQCVCFLYAR